MSTSAGPAIRTILLCDLVASTRLVERVGDTAAAELIARHDRIARDLLSAHNGREIDKSDGFLLLFERPIEAVRFALTYQSELRELDSRMTSRVGIHLGEVLLRENSAADVARGAKPVEVEGLAKAIAARVMSLAADGRILLTRAAYDVARRASVGIDRETALRWAVHGRYRLAGIEEPVEVCEVAVGAAALQAPARSEKAARADEWNDLGAEPLLAVLAFDNLSRDPDMEFFSDGVSEEIIQRLVRGAKLKVIGRTSSFQFRGVQKADAASTLRCSHVLDGAVRRAGERVRITAHLVDSASRTTLWSERYDRDLRDVFALQDEIAESIAGALDRAFSSIEAKPIDPAIYDLYLRSVPQSYAPDELRSRLASLETVTSRAPEFAEAWGRSAYVRAWLHFYQPFPERPASAARVKADAARALATDSENVDAMTALLFVVPPFAHFAEGDAVVERLMRAPASAEARRYVGWYLRTMGRVRESLEETERAYRLDALHPMSANLVALARMAAGRVAEAIPVFEKLMHEQPDMSFPVSSLLRCHALLQDWPAVDRVMEIASKRQLREFEDGLEFVRTKREPTPGKADAWRRKLEADVQRTGSVDLSRLVYSAHLGLVDDAYRVVESAALGPSGTADDVMGPDGYRTSLLFFSGMPELRNDPRFARLCARLGLVDFWMKTRKWPDCADEVPYDFRAACARAVEMPKEAWRYR